jgi:hypothetical protein
VLSAVAGCNFSTDITAVDAPGAMIDGRMIDGPENDVDGDGVLNTADNCPAIANPGQGNEDGDTKGDESDPFPHQTGTADEDGDTDGIGNGCYPGPGTAGDKLAYWNGFHVASATSGRGSDAWSSAGVQGALRAAVSARTLATSAGVTSQLPPNPLRTYDETAAIHSSLFVPIGTITCA